VEAQKDRTPGKAQIVIQVPERLGSNVIEAKGLTKAYGDKLLFDDLSFNLPPAASSGDRPERRRQDDLFKLITGAEQPDDGEVKVGRR
jgi:ATPase subunit of ABC transporter with duplicated ATPase domains